MNRRNIIPACIFIIFVVFSTSAFNGIEDPEYIAIQGATIIPVVGEDIPNGTILIKGALIEAVGKDITIPPGAKVIDAGGLYAYPGLIDGYSQLGLHEIGSIPATLDSNETGRINPQVRSLEAIRPESMHIPITRSNGITTALVAPSGGLIAGQSGVIKLTGWTPAEMTIKNPVAMHIEFPGMRRSRRRSSSQTQEQASKQIVELKELLKKTRFYAKRKAVAKKDRRLPLPEFDEKLEFLFPVISGEIPVFISVHGDKDILDAIKFVKEEKLKAIFFGVTYGWKVAGEIKKSGIPVVLGSLYAMPSKWEDGYDALYRNPYILHKAGVKIAFSSQSATLAKDLPYHASKAAAFGLDKREALKAVTIYPAQIFGLDKKLGSLEKGKNANIVLADDDILELRTNIKYVFIDGKQMDISSIYTKLLEKYKKRNK